MKKIMIVLGLFVVAAFVSAQNADARIFKSKRSSKQSSCSPCSKVVKPCTPVKNDPGQNVSQPRTEPGKPAQTNQAAKAVNEAMQRLRGLHTFDKKLNEVKGGQKVRMGGVEMIIGGASNSEALGKEIRKSIDELKKTDLSACPADFAGAYKRYANAWEAFRNADETEGGDWMAPGAAWGDAVVALYRVAGKYGFRRGPQDTNILRGGYNFE